MLSERFPLVYAVRKLLKCDDTLPLSHSSYHIHGTMSIPMAACIEDSDIPVTVTVELGDDLAPAIDDIPSNNMAVLLFPCRIGLSPSNGCSEILVEAILG